MNAGCQNPDGGCGPVEREFQELQEDVAILENLMDPLSSKLNTVLKPPEEKMPKEEVAAPKQRAAMCELATELSYLKNRVSLVIAKLNYMYGRIEL